MKHLKLFSIYSLIIISIIGCATSGKVFNYQNRNMIEIDKTNVNDAIQILGKPSSRESKSNENGTYEIVKYIYAKADPSGASARVFFLEFKNDKLNAKIYNSGFKEDITDFNYENYKNIKIGESNKNDVLNLLGAPSGIAICPSTLADFSDKCKDNSIIWTWIHTQKSQGYDTKTIKSKTIKVLFDENGIVKSVDSSKDL
jgi:hypothetical protein